MTRARYSTKEIPRAMAEIQSIHDFAGHIDLTSIPLSKNQTVTRPLPAEGDFLNWESDTKETRKGKILQKGENSVWLASRKH